ncbi:hypothetical protein [Ottowia sp.]|uniref:hypothetical protein n=1 Tax=Ottowia sp. TaxID=1898956 RepID=UPI0025EF5B5E|nr:hypothetical protein [Ottowia sp.]MBK6745483.1 hypothetical protein [Ottowia sp.]
MSIISNNVAMQYCHQQVVQLIDSNEGYIDFDALTQILCDILKYRVKLIGPNQMMALEFSLRRGIEDDLPTYFPSQFRAPGYDEVYEFKGKISDWDYRMLLALCVINSARTLRVLNYEGQEAMPGRNCPGCGESIMMHVATICAKCNLALPTYVSSVGIPASITNAAVSEWLDRNIDEK